MLSEQASMHRLHAVRYAIATKKQARTDLIYCRAEDGWLHRRPRPIGLQRSTASKSSHHKWRFSVASETLQTPCDLGDYGTPFNRHLCRHLKGMTDFLGTSVCIVDHQSPVDD